jgi:hypothetical protein
VDERLLHVGGEVVSEPINSEGNTMRACSFWLVLTGVLWLASGVASAAEQKALRSTPLGPGMEADTNRFGSDYRNFESLSAQQCQTECAKDAQCKAWTWVKPGVQGPSAKCWLKNAVPAKSPDACCISGVKATVPSASTNAVLTERGAESLVQSGILKPEVLSINNQRPAGYVFRAGIPVTIHGHGLGTGGQVRLLGSFRKPPSVIVSDWRPSVIYARLADEISGEEDLNDVRLEIQPTGGQSIVVRGVRFEAARETTLLKDIPQRYVTLPGQQATYWTNGGRPSLDGPWPIWEFLKSVRAQSAIVSRSNFGKPSAKWFAPGTDTYVLPLRTGFSISNYVFTAGPSDTHPSKCNTFGGGQYFQGRYGVTIEHPNVIKVDWGVGRCHISPILTESSSDANYSAYGLDVYVVGPRGLSPWK